MAHKDGTAQISSWGKPCRDTNRNDDHLSRFQGCTLTQMKPGLKEGIACSVAITVGTQYSNCDRPRSQYSPHGWGSCAAWAPHQETQGSLSAGRGPGVARESSLAGVVTLAALNTPTLYSSLPKEGRSWKCCLQAPSFGAPLCCIAAGVPCRTGAAHVGNTSCPLRVSHLEPGSLPGHGAHVGRICWLRWPVVYLVEWVEVFKCGRPTSSDHAI